MLIAVLFSVVTGVIKFPGFLALFGISLRRMPMPIIMKIHDWAGVALAASVLLHIILHLKWILKTTGDILRELRNSEKMPGQDRIYTAGEKEYYIWLERQNKGVPFNKPLLEEFRGLCKDYNLEEYLHHFS